MYQIQREEHKGCISKVQVRCTKESESLILSAALLSLKMFEFSFLAFKTTLNISEHSEMEDSRFSIFLGFSFSL